MIHVNLVLNLIILNSNMTDNLDNFQFNPTDHPTRLKMKTPVLFARITLLIVWSKKIKYKICNIIFGIIFLFPNQSIKIRFLPVLVSPIKLTVIMSTLSIFLLAMSRFIVLTKYQIFFFRSYYYIWLLWD